MSNNEGASDKRLYERFSAGDEKALKEIRNRYSGFVKSICKSILQKSGLHKHLSYSYLDVIDELESTVWVEVFSSLSSGFRFEQEDELKRLFAAVATNRTKDKVRKSAGARMSGTGNYPVTDAHDQTAGMAGQVSGEKLYRTFPSFYSILETEPDSLPFDSRSPESLNIDNDFLDRLIDRLTLSERKVLDLAFAGMKQNEMAKELNISIKTIYNRLDSIRAKALKLRES